MKPIKLFPCMAIYIVLAATLSGCSLFYPNVPPATTPPSVEASVTIEEKGGSVTTPEPNTTLEPATPVEETPSRPVTTAEQSGVVVESPNLQDFEMIDAQNGWGVTLDKVVRTVDGAVTWLDVTPPGLVANFYSRQGFYLDADSVWILIPDVNDPFKGTLYHTRDGGASWEISQTPFSSAIFNFINEEQGWVLFGTGAGAGSSGAEVHATKDGGQTWEKMHEIVPDNPDDGNSLPFSGIKTGIAFLDVERGWVTGEIPMDGFVYLYRTLDGGQTWQQQPVTLPAPLAQYFTAPEAPMFFSEKNGKLPMSLFAEQSATLVYTTIDGGQTWLATSPVPISGKTEFFNMQAGWVWDGQTIYGTLDGGQTWVTFQTNVDLRQTLISYDFVGPNVGFALAFDESQNILYRSDDAGQTWQPIP